MTTFSFNMNAPHPATPAQQASGPRMASPTQVSMYADLVAKRRIRAAYNIAAMTYEQAFEVINDAKGFYGASDAQIETIKRMFTQLQNAGEHVNMPGDDFFNRLTGGEGGSANTLIQTLITKTREIDTKEPPTPAVVSYIVKMFYYPDVDWESFGVPTKIPVDMLYNADGSPICEKPLFRHVQPQEFGEYILANKTAKECQQFLDTYRVGFNTYRNTRIRPEQERFIRTLEGRLASLSKPRVAEWAVDIEGNMVQVSTSGSSRDWNPSAYTTVYDDMQIRMLSIEQASAVIEKLQEDLAQPNEYSIDDKDVTFESLRHAKTQYEASVMEMKELNNFIHAVFAHTGCESDDARVIPYHDEHDRITQEKTIDEFFKAESFTGKRKRNMIRDYLMFVMDADYVTLHTLRIMAERSVYATELVEDIATNHLNIKFRKPRAK